MPGLELQTDPVVGKQEVGRAGGLDMGATV